MAIAVDRAGYDTERRQLAGNWHNDTKVTIHTVDDLIRNTDRSVFLCCTV